MGSMVFKRLAGDGSVERVVSFDSSPVFSLSQGFGWHKDSIRLERMGGDSMVTRYDVYGSSTPGGKAVKVGTLSAKSREAIWAER